MEASRGFHGSDRETPMEANIYSMSSVEAVQLPWRSRMEVAALPLLNIYFLVVSSMEEIKYHLHGTSGVYFFSMEGCAVVEPMVQFFAPTAASHTRSCR